MVPDQMVGAGHTSKAGIGQVGEHCQPATRRKTSCQDLELSRVRVQWKRTNPLCVVVATGGHTCI